MRAICVILIVLSLTGCRRDRTANPGAVRPPTRLEIWAAIQPLAARYHLSPAFIYALVAAESNFDPQARNGAAQGLLQIKPVAWHAVSTLPFEPGVWNWRTNLEVGVDYLAYSQVYLRNKATFSYLLLLAAFHYGLDYVEDRDFQRVRIRVPDNVIYRELWSGNLAPVPPPS